MKKKYLMIILGFLFLMVPISSAEEKVLKDHRDRISYIIGMDMGMDLKRQLIHIKDINPDAILRGLKDAFSGEKPLLTKEEIRETITSFQKEIKGRQEETMKRTGEKNKKEGETFLAENKNKEDVITLHSGLQYRVIKQGTGKKPKLTDTVTTHYRGTLVDGTEFDSSYKRGQPISFPVNGVIPGWTEALQLMEEGAKWQLFIPPQLAYGERGAGPIGPNSTLIFEVELISVQEKK